MENQSKTVAFMTLGCKVNSYDSEAMMEIFEKDGYKIVGFSEVADVYVVNTCTVTHLGDRKSRNMMRKAKRLNPKATICAVGCYVQTSPEEVLKIEEVDLMLGTKNRSEILNYIKSHEKDKTARDFVSDIMTEKVFEPLVISESKGKTRAFIKIQEGCNRFCTYCIVPYARGPVRSRPLEAVVKEVKRMVNSGYKEIVLTGIHIASYGVDLLEKNDLIDLMEALNKIEDLERIRLGSLEPLFMTPQRLDRLVEMKSFCPHFHLSLQSGSDTVLKRMGRRYEKAEYLEIVKEIRKRFPLAAITTDIMVGFPGETQEEFYETISFVKAVSFYQVHVFKYSKRAGTKAAKYLDQVDEGIKTQRSHRLTEVSKGLEIEFLKKNNGKIAEVLFEDKNKNDYWEGHTKNYIPVVLKTTEKINGKILRVGVSYINEAEKKLTGKILERIE